MVPILLRRVAEFAGVAGYVVVHGTAVPLVVVLGSGLRPVDRMAGIYYAVLAAGYLLTWTVLIRALRERRSADRNGTGWALLDSWLIAFLVALVATAVLVLVRLPLRLGGWDGHGFGATGGEANVVFLPWLHLVFWLGLRTRLETGAQGRG